MHHHSPNISDGFCRGPEKHHGSEEPCLRPESEVRVDNTEGAEDDEEDNVSWEVWNIAVFGVVNCTLICDLCTVEEGAAHYNCFQSK